MISTDPKVHWQERARWVEDGRFLTSSGITAGMDVAFAFLARTWVALEDRMPIAALQGTSARGDTRDIPGCNRDKALQFAREVAFDLEYRWCEDPGDDPFVESPYEFGWDYRG